MMLILLTIFANSAFAFVRADLVVKPLDTEAVIGDSTYFDCASNVDRNEVHWYHYAVGAKHHEDICLYCMGTVHPQYEHRIEVERHLGIGHSRLRINSMQRRDAGRYICQDNGGIGESASAQLVILESSPTCASNMKPDGVLGPNDCGLEPDILHLSCHVSYHGNIPPVITWRKSETEDPVNPLICQNIGNRMTCNLTMMVDLGLNGVSFTCQTNRSTTAQYNCVSDIIRVIYVKPDNFVKKMVQGAEENVTCSVNSSQSCNLKWKWFDGVHEEIVANGAALVTHKPGWYKCESECNIRSKQCTVISKLVHVSETQSLSMSMVVIVSCAVTIAAGVFGIGLVYIICPRIRNKTKHLFTPKAALLEESRSLTEAEQKKSVGSTVTTKAAKEHGKLIRGMTILADELFVVSQRSSEVEVFDCNTLVPRRQWTLTELIRPSDIASCKVNRCLYIMDWKGDSKRKEVLCVDPNGTLSRSWETSDDYGYLISVTKGNNILVTYYGKNELSEYSPQGMLIRKIALQGVDVPTYAIKLSSGDFMVSSGDAIHLLHRVCIVGTDGRVKNSFGREKGSDLEHLDHPMHLAVFADGSVAVLDSGNRRVLLLDKDLQFDRVLLSNKMYGLQNPIRLLLDESSDRLFVADSHNGTGRVLVFHLNEIH